MQEKVENYRSNEKGFRELLQCRESYVLKGHEAICQVTERSTF